MEIPTEPPITDPHTDGKLKGNLLQNYERFFRTTFWRPEVFLICAGQFFITRDAEEGPNEMIFFFWREDTKPRDQETSRARGWILKNTRIGPVLDVKVCLHLDLYGIEIFDRILVSRWSSFMGSNRERNYQICYRNDRNHSFWILVECIQYGFFHFQRAATHTTQHTTQHTLRPPTTPRPRPQHNIAHNITRRQRKEREEMTEEERRDKKNKRTRDERRGEERRGEEREERERRNQTEVRSGDSGTKVGLDPHAHHIRLSQTDHLQIVHYSTGKSDDEPIQSKYSQLRMCTFLQEILECRHGFWAPEKRKQRNKMKKEEFFQ